MREKLKAVVSGNFLAIALLLAVAFSIYTHSMVFREWTMPTYGNTFIHVASVRHSIEYGTYPVVDYSYGGGVPNLYVPFYRIFIADAVLLTGLSIDFVSRMAVMLFAVLLPLGMFALARRLFGVEAGFFAAFLASLPGELLIYTVRPLPQSLGMVLLPVAFLALFSGKRKASLFMAFAISMVHQEAAVFFAGCALAYFVLAMFLDAEEFWRPLSVMAAAAFALVLVAYFSPAFLVPAVAVSAFCFAAAVLLFHRDDSRSLAFLAFLVCVAAYFLWHYWVMHSFNVFDIAQFKNHEGGLVSLDSYVSKTGVAVAVLSLAGALLAALAVLKSFLGQLDSYLKRGPLARQAFANSVIFLALAGAYFADQLIVLKPFSLSAAAGALPPLLVGVVSALAYFAAIPLFVSRFPQSKALGWRVGVALLFVNGLFVVSRFAAPFFPEYRLFFDAAPVAAFAIFLGNSLLDETVLSAIPAGSSAFAFALFAAGFAAVKNDALGVRVFMDRFLVYLQEPLVLLAALGCYSLYAVLKLVSRRP